MTPTVSTATGFCSHLAHGDAATSLRAAAVALTHTSEVPVPAKLVLARGHERPSLRVETFDGAAADTLALAFEADRHYRRLAPSHRLTHGGASPSSIHGEIADALAAADWIVAPEAAAQVAAKARAHATSVPARAALRATPPFAQASPVTLTTTASGFVRVALGADVVRAGHEHADDALRLFALQACARLVLARPTVTTHPVETTAKIMIGWDAIVPSDAESCERSVAAIAHAAAAIRVARELTFETFELLAASADMARAYIARDPRFASFRSLAAEATPPASTATNDDDEEDSRWTPQPLL